MSLPMPLPRLASLLLLAKLGDRRYHFGANAAAASIPVIQHSNVGGSREFALGTMQGEGFDNSRSTVCLVPKLSESPLITTREDYGSACFLLRVSFRCRSGPNSSPRWSITLKGTPVATRENVLPTPRSSSG